MKRFEVHCEPEDLSQNGKFSLKHHTQKQQRNSNINSNSNSNY
jgi:hypothetical protein